MIKKYAALFVIALSVVAGIFFFFYRMSRNDAKALADFSVAYENYDRSIAEFSNAVFVSNPGGTATGDLERRVDEALAALNIKASVRISSLTKNDGDIMKAYLEIADLAGKEFDALKAYQSAVAAKNTDLDQLAREFHVLQNQRQAAYSRYLDLAGGIPSTFEPAAGNSDSHYRH